MKSMTLTRFNGNPDGVFGRMGSWVTLERPDLENRVSVSCIPIGSYVCERGMFNRGGYETFLITDVPDRTLICFHKANTKKDLRGCIGLGMRLGVLKVQGRHTLAVLSSKKAFDAFMKSWEGVDEFVLRIIDHRPWV